MANNNMWNNPANQSPNSMIVFVSDDSMAMNYPIAPGYTVALINANDPGNGKLFIRSSEPNGMPKAARIFSIKEITPQQNNGDSVSHKDFDVLSQQVADMSSQFRQMLNVLNAMQAAAPVVAQVAPAAAAPPRGGKKQ